MANSFFKNTLDRMVSARERQARLYVNATLINMDDKFLEQAGRSRSDISKEGYRPYVF